MQRDIALQGWAERQTARDAQLVAQALTAAQQTSIMHRTQGHANLGPIVLKEMQRWGRAKIGKSEVLLVVRMESRTVRELLNSAVLGSNRLIDPGMIDRMLVVFGWRPGKNKYVMPFAGIDFSEGAVANFLHGDHIHCDLGLVPLAPLRSHYVNEPIIEFGEEVRPFGDLQGILAGESVRPKYKKRPHSRRSGGQLDEIAASNPLSLWLGHPLALPRQIRPWRGLKPCQGPLSSGNR